MLCSAAATTPSSNVAHSDDFNIDVAPLQAFMLQGSQIFSSVSLCCSLSSSQAFCCVSTRRQPRSVLTVLLAKDGVRERGVSLECKREREGRVVTCLLNAVAVIGDTGVDQ